MNGIHHHGDTKKDKDIVTSLTSLILQQILPSLGFSLKQLVGFICSHEFWARPQMLEFNNIVLPLLITII